MRAGCFPPSFSINDGDFAWNWVLMQIKTNVLDESWMHSPILAEIADIFARTFAMMGNCRLPLYISETKAEECFDIWRLINEQRMERFEWPLSWPDA